MKLVSSDALLFEIVHIPDHNRETDVLAILTIATETINLTPKIEKLARNLGKSGLKTLDALHLAFAFDSKVDYFCTCDDKLLKKARNLSGLNTRVVSPTELVMELEI